MQETSQAETETQLWLAGYSSQQYSQRTTGMADASSGAEAPRNERVDHFGFPSRFRGLGR
jgi:hypothetical protein